MSYCTIYTGLIWEPKEADQNIADSYSNLSQRIVAPEAVNAELLEALKAMVKDFDGCYAEGEPAMIKARAAIAKAEGSK